MVWRSVEAELQAAVGVVFPSAQLVVVDGGTRCLSLALGNASAATVFDLASLTKPLVTTTLIAQLIDEQRLSLSDMVDDRFTVGELLSHSSGLPSWKALAPPGVVDKAFVLAEIRRTAPAYVRGTRSIYSDLGFILLGNLLEQRLGPLDQAFATCVAEPLGLALTFHPTASQCAPTEGNLCGVVHDDNARAMGGVAGHAGLFGSANEIAKLVAVLVEIWHGDQGLLSPATLQHFWSGAGVPDSTWCLGWDRPSAHGSSAGEHWPKDGVGHLAFTGCSVWIDPRRRRFVVLASNRVHPTRDNERIRQLRPRLHDLIVKVLDF